MAGVETTGISARGVRYWFSMDAVLAPRMTKARFRGLQSGRKADRPSTGCDSVNGTIAVEKLYPRTPSGVQDNVDFSGFSPRGAAISDPENQRGLPRVVMGHSRDGISTYPRPRGPAGAAFRRSPRGRSVVLGVAGSPGCSDSALSDAVSVACPEDENHPRPYGPRAAARRPSGGRSVVSGAGVAGASALTAQPLGRYTKSSPPPPPVDGRRKVRAERYEHLGTARDLLLAKGRAAGLEHPANYSRTAKCMHTPHGEVAVLRGAEHGTAFFRGLVACGSVWACPVCAAKVQERRREEIAKGFDWAYVQGLQPVMITLTFPHKAWHELEDLVLQQRAALKMLRKGRGWDKFMMLAGYQGLIRALEITHGRNGWHPHVHEIWFVSKDTEAGDLVPQILKKWASACARAGLLDPKNNKQMKAFARHAVDVKGNCATSDYLAKADDAKHWGADREMSKGSTKAGRAKGQHPFGLLANAGAGDRRAGELYVEFVDTMKSTRSRQLFWAPGLKKRVGLVEKTDEELAEEEREPADLLGLLERGDWERVRRHRKRAQLLDAAELGGWSAVTVLVESLRRRARSALDPYASPSVVAPPGPS